MSHNIYEIFTRIVQSFLKALPAVAQIFSDPQIPPVGPQNIFTSQTDSVGGHSNVPPTQLLLRNTCKTTGCANRMLHSSYGIWMYSRTIHWVVGVTVLGFWV